VMVNPIIAVTSVEYGYDRYPILIETADTVSAYHHVKWSMIRLSKDRGRMGLLVGSLP
jgi:hypothetical protein